MNDPVVIPVQAFRDNYLWLLVRGLHAAVIDPGDAAPVLRYLQQHGLTLCAILVTHGHHDHIGGVSELLSQYDVPVYAPNDPLLDFPYQPVADGETIHLPQLDYAVRVLDVPGHTAIHVAYYGGNSLFCGDTLFGCGCGRIFPDGSCEQLYTSLQKLAQLPDATRVYCTHEYTLDNIHFALSVDPNNADLITRKTTTQALIAQGKPTLPSTLALEKATNPFLRCHILDLRQSVQNIFLTRNEPLEHRDAAIFCALRSLKNNYQSNP